MKPELKKLNKKDFSDVSTRVLCSRLELENIQIKLDKSPLSQDLQVAEREMYKKYVDLCQVEESLAHQKSRIQWLKLGDRNSSFFFRSVRNNNNRSRINCITLDNGERLTKPPDIHEAFVDHFSKLFGIPGNGNYKGFDRVNSLIKKKLSNNQMVSMARDVTDEEIKDVVWSLNPNKAPGPDGFSASFFP